MAERVGPGTRTSAGGVAGAAADVLRQRARTWTWRSIVAIWVVVSVAVAGLAAVLAGAHPHDHDVPAGVTAFGVVAFLLLGVSLLVTPPLAAPGLARGRTPAENALGRFLAAWAGALVLPFAILPAFGVAMRWDGVSPGAVLACLAMVAALLGIVAALSVGISAFVTGTLYPVLLAHLAVLALCAGPPVVFTLATGPLDDEFAAARYWQVVAPSPVLVLADAVPRVDDGGHTDRFRWDPLGGTSEWARGQRDPRLLDSGGVGVVGFRDDGASVWRTGLAADAVLGAAGLLGATRRRPPRAAW